MKDKIIESENMNWNYSELSKKAKQAGGPEQFAENLIQSGRDEMQPIICIGGFAIATAASLAGYYIPNKLVPWLKETAEKKKGEKRLSTEELRERLTRLQNDFEACKKRKAS